MCTHARTHTYTHTEYSGEMMCSCYTMIWQYLLAVTMETVSSAVLYVRSFDLI